ncbi:TPA: hypothetical protein ACH3X1_013859 [Trebouxia sp. C0004]
MLRIAKSCKSKEPSLRNPNNAICMSSGLLPKVSWRMHSIWTQLRCVIRPSTVKDIAPAVSASKTLRGKHAMK